MSRRGSGWGRALWLAVGVIVVAASGAVPVPVGASSGTDTLAAPQEAQSGPASPPGVLPAGGHWTVTLLSGEVVEVASDAEGKVAATITRHHGSVRSWRTPDGALYVVPTAVTPLLADVLDRELFNVTGLIRQGYDDAASPSVPLIVQSPDGAAALSGLAATDAGRPLPSIGAVAVSVPKPVAAADGGSFLASLGGGTAGSSRDSAADRPQRVWLDRRVTTRAVDQEDPAAGRPPRLDPNLTQIGADDAWADGYTGEGVRVAVLDTGIDPTHPDLAGQIVASENFSDSPDTVDRFGHGTHVAALVAGTGTAAGGARRGVAPDAELLVGKVLNDEGFGSESGVIAGMEWAAPQADVVNMSLGDDWPSDGSDPLSTALDTLSKAHGTLFVVAAGNAGPASGSVGSPAAADTALTVGAVDGADDVADFSSRGPLITSNELKPEVVAPGVDVVSARAAHTAMGEPVDASYTAASGTSMATPHVAGAAAVLAQRHPDWSGEQLKNALIGAADPIEADGFDAGSGRLDVDDALDVVVLPDRDVVDVSLPHPRTSPHEETVTWTNTGDAPATVSLSAAVADRAGEPVDAVSVAPASLTIPAGGTGTATVTIDGAALAGGLYSGTVDAVLADGEGAGAGAGTGGDDVRAPVGILAGPETAELTVEATTHPDQGDNTPLGLVSILNLDDAAVFANLNYYYEGDSFTVTVPVGRYAVVGEVMTRDLDSDVVAVVGDPDVVVDGDTTVAFDASTAVPLAATVEGRDTIPVATNVGAVLTPDAGTAGFSFVTDMYSWYPAPPVYVTPMSGDPDNYAPRAPVTRLQAPVLSASSGGAAIAVSFVQGQAEPPPLGAHTLPAVYAGDGSDFSAARDALAVVALPADYFERIAVTERAQAAGVAMLAFVDEARAVVTPHAGFGGPWAPVPVVAAAGRAATALRLAGEAGQPVTVTVQPSPYVYDLVLPVEEELDLTPVVTRRQQRRLARLSESYHHDGAVPAVPGVPAVAAEHTERRRAVSVSAMELDTVGPLPVERDGYLTPGVAWQSYVFGDGLFWAPGFPFPLPGRLAFSITPETTYRPGARETLEWLSRPMAPAPFGGPPEDNFCQPRPVTRTFDTLYVELETFVDEPGRYTCASPSSSRLQVERDGVVVATTPQGSFVDVPVPPEPGQYRLVYEQSGETPYPQSSTTAWSFPSAGAADVGVVRIPLLVVDYDLPLDVLNRPTDDVGRLTVRQVAGSARSRITGVEVWTSTDGGTTWQPSRVRRGDAGTYTFDLPDTAAGTPSRCVSPPPTPRAAPSTSRSCPPTPPDLVRPGSTWFEGQSGPPTTGLSPARAVNFFLT